MCSEPREATNRSIRRPSIAQTRKTGMHSETREGAVIPITIYGAGSWGTTLAIHLARQGQAIALWARHPAHREQMMTSRENNKYLPGISFPGFIHVLREAEPPASAGEVAVLAVPSHAFREILQRIPRPEPRLWVVATKGLEEGTAARMSEVLIETRQMSPGAGVVLAGPSLAREVIEEKPAALLAASESEEAAKEVQSIFSTNRFRVYTSDDVVGVELATALKNVIALAAGIADGLELGWNARGALLTRGLAEITRLGLALGAQTETFLGLAGVGDMVATCTSSLSRNHTLGEQIARGVPLEAAIDALGQVAEGVRTARAAVTLAETVGVDVPIARAVERILFEGLDPSTALQELMTRPLRSES